MFPFFDLKMNLKSIFCFILVLMLNACSGINSIYNTSVNLSSQTAVNESESFSINLPIGWRKIISNGEEFADLWIVNDNDEYSILFTPVKSTIESQKEKSELNSALKSLLIIYIESLFRGKSYKKSIESFEAASQYFEAIEISLNKDRQRFVIFGLNDNYYISRAIAISENPNHEELFNTQNSILASIKRLDK
jgi:hypothetical protein